MGSITTAGFAKQLPGVIPLHFAEWKFNVAKAAFLQLGYPIQNQRLLSLG